MEVKNDWSTYAKAESLRQVTNYMLNVKMQEIVFHMLNMNETSNYWGHRCSCQIPKNPARETQNRGPG